MQGLTQENELTEKEILRSLPSEYMNERQLEFFRARLNAMRAELKRNADRTADSLRNEILGADPLDRATLEEERSIELRTRERERHLDMKIERALARIDEGTYGYCVETGEPIGLPRMLARPIADLTVDAQERHERRKIMGSE